MNIIAPPPPTIGNSQDDYVFTPSDLLYAQELLFLAKNREEKVFNNGKSAHAAIVMENIFRETKNNKEGGEIRIYGKNLNGEISRFSNYRHGLLEFLLAKNTSIKVIVDEEPNEDSRSVNAATNAFELLKTFSKTVRIGSKIQMRKVSNLNNVVSLIQGELQYKDVHFAVSTENMYRLELDSKLHFAECSFNGKETSNTLIKIFDKMFLDQDGIYTMPIN